MLDPDEDANDTGLGFLDDATELIESNSPPLPLLLSRTDRLLSSLVTRPTLAGALVGRLLLSPLWPMTIVLDSALIAIIRGLCSDLRPNWRGIVVVGGGV